jgi:hypothetical protein
MSMPTGPAFAAAIAALLLGATSAVARSPATDLEKGRALYAADYEAALAVLDGVTLEAGATVSQRVAALELQAFALYLLGHADEARNVWVELLGLDPKHALDPVYVSPDLITFFGRVPPPAPEEAAPPPAPVLEKASGPPPPPVQPPAAPPPRGCGNWLCLIPFGVGQYANGRPIKGTIFALSEAAFLGLNISLYWANKVEIDTYGYYRDPAAADRNFVIQHVALAFFGAALIGGIIDAYLAP